MNNEQHPSTGKGPQMEAPRTIQAIVEETMQSLLLTGSRNISGTKKAVIAASRNIMQKILLADGDMPRAAVELLRTLGDVAQKTNFDSAEVMKWGLEAVAGIAAVAPTDMQDSILKRIDATFMDTGAIFSDFLAKSPRANE